MVVLLLLLLDGPCFELVWRRRRRRRRRTLGNSTTSLDGAPRPCESAMTRRDRHKQCCSFVTLVTWLFFLLLYYNVTKPRPPSTWHTLWAKMWRAASSTRRHLCSSLRSSRFQISDLFLALEAAVEEVELEVDVVEKEVWVFSSRNVRRGAWPCRRRRRRYWLRLTATSVIIFSSHCVRCSMVLIVLCGRGCGPQTKEKDSNTSSIPSDHGWWLDVLNFSWKPHADCSKWLRNRRDSESNFDRSLFISSLDGIGSGLDWTGLDVDCVPKNDLDFFWSELELFETWNSQTHHTVVWWVWINEILFFL